jgi:hypothetical protein
LVADNKNMRTKYQDSDIGRGFPAVPKTDMIRQLICHKAIIEYAALDSSQASASSACLFPNPGFNNPKSADVKI